VGLLTQILENPSWKSWTPLVTPVIPTLEISGNIASELQIARDLPQLRALFKPNAAKSQQISGLAGRP
jgi:hypothetical protein